MGAGAGVEFDFEKVEIQGDARQWKELCLGGELSLSSAHDASYVFSQSEPLGALEILEDKVYEELEYEMEHYKANTYEGESTEEGEPDWSTLEVNVVTLHNKIYGAGWTRADFDGTLEVEVDVDVVVQTVDGEWHTVANVTVPAYIKFHPQVVTAYEQLDEPDRYDGYNTVFKEDQTFTI
jgi:hypothetical protein